MPAGQTDLLCNFKYSRANKKALKAERLRGILLRVPEIAQKLQSKALDHGLEVSKMLALTARAARLTSF